MAGIGLESVQPVEKARLGVSDRAWNLSRRSPFFGDTQRPIMSVMFNSSREIRRVFSRFFPSPLNEHEQVSPLPANPGAPSTEPN
jgi:hypothetical protein